MNWLVELATTEYSIIQREIWGDNQKVNFYFSLGKWLCSPQCKKQINLHSLVKTGALLVAFNKFYNRNV